MHSGDFYVNNVNCMIVTVSVIIGSYTENETVDPPGLLTTLCATYTFSACATRALKYYGRVLLTLGAHAQRGLL